MKFAHVLVLCSLCASVAATSDRKLLSLRRLATTPAEAVTKYTELETALKTVEDRITNAKSMPLDYFAVRTTLIESKACVKQGLAIVQAAKVAVTASKFYKPLMVFSKAAEQVLKTSKSILDNQDSKIATPVASQLDWSGGFVAIMEGKAKTYYNKVVKVDAKMKKFAGYAEKAKEAAAMMSKAFGFVEQFAPMASTAGQANANEAAQRSTAISDPMLNYVTSINTNTDAMYKNMQTVGTALDTVKGAVDKYKSGVCLVQEPLKKILDLIQPFVDVFEKKVCLPCACTSGVAEQCTPEVASKCTPAVASKCTGGVASKCTGGVASKCKGGSARKCNDFTGICIPAVDPVCTPAVPQVCTPEIPSVCTPAVPSVCTPAVPSVCTPAIPAGCLPSTGSTPCTNNEACMSAKDILASADAWMKPLNDQVDVLLQPLLNAAKNAMPTVPIPDIDFGIPEFSALDTLDFDFEVESLENFAKIATASEGIKTQANMVQYLNDCTLPQYLQPAALTGDNCVNGGFGTGTANAAALANLDTLIAEVGTEAKTVPTAATVVSPITIPTAIPYVPPAVAVVVKSLKVKGSFTIAQDLSGADETQKKDFEASLLKAFGAASGVFTYTYGQQRRHLLMAPAGETKVDFTMTFTDAASADNAETVTVRALAAAIGFDVNGLATERLLVTKTTQQAVGMNSATKPTVTGFLAAAVVIAGFMLMHN